MGAFAWVTLATNDSYSLGALVLAHSLRRVGTPHDLAVLITPGVTQSMREKLAAVFNLVREVNVLDSKDEANLAVLQRPELGITFTKLHCWRLTQYEKCVFVDADALVVKNCDRLFEREELSAAPDVGWPDCFNSGVFVFKPSQETFAAIATFAASQGSFDGADQGLLNMYFSDWAHKDISKHLPFIYNMCSTATYSYAPAFKQFGANVKIIHFIGSTKPWLQYFDTLTGYVHSPPGCEHLLPFLQMWWNIFCENVHPQLTDVMGGLAGALSRLTMGEARSDEQRAIEDHMRKQNWEQGQIDFMGRDSFDNILKKINETLASGPQRQPSPVKEIRQSKKSSRKSSEVEAAVEESEAALPVLETEDQPQTSSTQESSEDTCQRISENVSSPINIEQQLTQSSSVIVTSEVDKASEQISTLDQNIISESLEKSVPITQSIDVSQTNVQEGLTEPQVSLEVKQIDEKSETSPDLTSLISSDLPETELDKPLATQEIKTQVVSEAITECPVPIQVAESVLQAEPKETVSEDPRPVIEAVASTIIPSVQESAASITEALIQPEGNVPSDQTVQTQQLNGNDPFLQSGEEQLLPPSAVNDVQDTSGPNNLSRDQDCTPTEQQSIQSVAEQAQPESESQLEAKENDAISLENVPDAKEESSSQKPKLTVQLPQSQLEKVEDEVLVQTLTTELQLVESELPLESLSTISDSLVTPDTEPPVRPSRSKDLKIPGTPTITGPTPPTSPPLESEATLTTQEDSKKQFPTEIESSAQSESQIEEPATVTSDVASETPTLASTDILPENLVEPTVPSQPEQASETEKTVKKSKKIVKKSSAESDTPSSPESEGSGKKVVKKVVKKVSKKSKESAEGEGEGGSSEKPKKTTKKLTKASSASLEADTTVPETPPPSASSEPPVPPKRKSKSSSSTKVTDKKSDES